MLRSVRGMLSETMAGTTIRFAAIADVHGNDLALEAVIADIRAICRWKLARHNGQPELASALATGRIG